MAKNPFACAECHLIIPEEKKPGPYSHKKKNELVQELNSRELSTVGKVDALIFRLIQNDLEKLGIDELADELSRLNPEAKAQEDKEQMISMVLKETTKKYEPKCPRHPSARVSTDHQGYVIIMNPSRSDIAKRLEVQLPGKYALKVSNL